MRLHHLQVTAFGPFAETVEIDFDALSAAGLFLLSGPTGAGKTSVLDAVCFALYGDVPGDRSAAKRLHSDHATPGVAPEVSLEVTLAGRRFRLVRSPAWERPKKRGTGTTRQQAHVVIQERVDDRWEVLSTRLDEAGDLVQSLVGMNLAQFCQVAMLPQGKFQGFLRARSEDRQALLQQLFRTGRFARMETWLRERRLVLHRASRECHDQVAGLVNRFSEVTDHPCDDAWDLAALEGPADEGALHRWGADGVAALSARVVTATKALGGVQGRELDARSRVEDARELERRQAAFHAAQREWDVLLSTAERHRARVAEIDSARRADAVAPLLGLARSSRRRTEEQVRRVAALSAELAALGIDLDTTTPSAARVRLTEERRSLAPALEAEAGLQAVRSRRALLEAELTRARDHASLAAEMLTEVPARRSALEDAVREAHAARVHLPGLETQLADVLRRLDAHRDVEQLVRELAVAEEERRTFRDEAQQLQQSWLDLREARLAGMAAEIAGDLTVGCLCPVCGSAQHPRPAVPAPGAPDAESERVAQRRADDAKSVLAAHDDRVHQLRTRLEVARGAAGGESAETLTDSLTGLERDTIQARTLAEAHDVHAEALAALAAEEESLHARRRAAEHDAASLAASLVEVEQDERRRAETVRAALTHSSATTAAELAATLARQEAAAHQVAEAHDALRLLESEEGRHRAALADALDAHAFDDEQAAEAAIRTPAEREQLAVAVQQHEEARARVSILLQDAALQGAAALPAPDLIQAEADHASSHAAFTAALSELDRATRARERAEQLVARLRVSLDAWEPLRQEHATVAALSAFAEGKSADNRLQMRLSAYVLAYRLTQVVEAANLRLCTMSDQRYSLQHAAQRGAGETRGGLSISVLDEWSGASRDPATLSGGETFIVSLALALGLADVITQEAGGAMLDTLFVDEGFGSLDAESLDHVLDTLDSLREGGRVVGVVSHVTEMSERIPTQLQVLKARRGSAVRVCGA